MSPIMTVGLDSVNSVSLGIEENLVVACISTCTRNNKTWFDIDCKQQTLRLGSVNQYLGPRITMNKNGKNLLDCEHMYIQWNSNAYDVLKC